MQVDNTPDIHSGCIAPAIFRVPMPNKGAFDLLSPLIADVVQILNEELIFLEVVS